MSLSKFVFKQLLRFLGTLFHLKVLIFYLLSDSTVVEHSTPNRKFSVYKHTSLSPIPYITNPYGFMAQATAVCGFTSSFPFNQAKEVNCTEFFPLARVPCFMQISLVNSSQ